MPVTQKEQLMEKLDKNPKVPFDMTSCDSNAFMLMGLFKRAAKKVGWSDEDISAVLEEARRGDYDHLVGTLVTFCE